jgi:hypothetical protein
MFTRDRMFILPALTAEALSRLSKRRIRRLPRANAGPPARAREDSPRAGARGQSPRGARGGCRVRRRDTSVTRPMRADIRVGAEPAKRRVSAFRRVRGKRNAGISRGAMHGQGQKRRRRDARAGSEAPKARCTGRVRSASAHLVVNVVFDEVLRG